MNRLGEKNTFVDEVYNEFLASDYGVTDTDLNPKRDTTEKMEPAEEVLNKLYGIVESEYKAVSERYDIENIEEIKNDLINTGEIISVQMTLQEELLETRLGGSLANFGFLIGGADNELPIEKDIKELMLDLLIIEHHFGKSKEEEEKEKDKTKGGGGGGGGSGGGGGGDGDNTGGTGDGDSGGGGGETGNPPGGGDGGGTGPGPGPGPGGGSGGGGSGGDDDDNDDDDGDDDDWDKEPDGDTEPPTAPDPESEGDNTPPSEEDKVDDVDPVNDYDNDDANPYKISCFICNDENGEKPTFSAKLTPAEVQRLKEMGIGVERMADDSADDTTDDKTVTETEDNDNKETSFSPKEIADCAKYDLQILNIILVVCKIIRALTLILDPIYAITTQIIELAALACGCWSSPANVSEIVQRLIQVVISAATNAVSTLIDKLWKMLGLNCLTETSIDLINKIQNALTGLGKISQSVKTTANKFVKTADNIYQDSAQVIEAWNNAKSQFLAKRENDFKSLFNKEAMFGSEGFLQDFKNTLWDNTSTNGWLTGPAASILGNSQVAKDIKDVKKLVESEIEKNRDGKQIKETFGKETQRWSELSEYFMKNTHFSETDAAWSEGVANFWNWERTNEDGTKDSNLSAGEILLNGFGIDNGSNSRATSSSTRSSSSQSKANAKAQVNNLAAEQESNETPAKSVDNVNDPN